MSKVHKMVLVSMFAVLTCIGAFIKIQLPLVPFSFQIFFVILSGLLLGSKLGMLSQLIYIAIGLAGFPVFTGGGGLSYLTKPTFGYIIGFVAAAYITGKIKEIFDSKGITFTKLFASSFAGILSCYIFGVAYLIFYTKFIISGNPNLTRLLLDGFLVFLPWDIIKIAVAAWVSNEVVKRIGEFKLRGA
ncbi:MAG TPA: biotin transporter BioY [Pseudobacteroides sp.]|uniref:biotin transporter BioY n=1 Tax=Pseudobacteroides sp. TaxID=1968840 RepID=UPI002F953E47